VAVGGYGNNDGGADAGHVRVYAYGTLSWSQLGADIDGEAAGDLFGHAVSLSSDGSRVAIGATYNDAGGVTSTGHTRVFEYLTSSWTQLGADIDGELANDYSGFAVCLSGNGSRVAIGAIDDDGSFNNAGHVRVFDYISSSWSQVGADIDGEAVGDQSGRSIALSSDGSRVAIGARLNDNGGGVDAGHVRVYEYNSSAWVQLGADIDGEAAADNSGWSVSLSSAGDYLAIGAFNNADGGIEAGHVRVYKYDSFAWTQLGADIDGKASSDQSGVAVSLSSDGSRVAIGAYLNAGGGTDAGHVRIFDYDFLSSSWVQMGADINGDAERGSSGYAVSLSADGSRVAIGAYNASSGGSGQVRVWQLDYLPSGQPTGQPTFGLREWFQVGSDIDMEAGGDASGEAVSLSSDGTRVAIGA
jgi:hypothetical protein